MNKALCCKVGCRKDAVWQIWTGNTPDDYTEACQVHVGDLLLPGVQNDLHPIPETPSEEPARE